MGGSRLWSSRGGSFRFESSYDGGWKLKKLWHITHKGVAGGGEFAVDLWR